MSNLNWCMCWRTEWEYNHMTDDKGGCKHCGKRVKFFFVKKVTA